MNIEKFKNPCFALQEKRGEAYARAAFYNFAAALVVVAAASVRVLVRVGQRKRNENEKSHIIKKFCFHNLLLNALLKHKTETYNSAQHKRRHQDHQKSAQETGEVVGVAAPPAPLQ